MNVRLATPGDLDAVAELCVRLWPDESAEVHRGEVAAVLEGAPPSTLPLVIFVAEAVGELLGFIEVGLRSHADGCDPRRPCGFVEAWFVRAEHRREGVGRRLMGQAEAWARAQGCIELASDTWSDRELSRRAHAACGFEVVDTCTNFRKALGAVPERPAGLIYGAVLARLHHRHFGFLARSAAGELLARLAALGVASGTVVDLAAGSGLLSARVAAAGFDVFGVDLSLEMLELARAEAPTARLLHGSLWTAPLPPCVAVAAVGEALSYAADPLAAGAGALEALFGACHRALKPGGLLLFDVAGPGRSGPSGHRRAFWTFGEGHLGLEESEDGPAHRLARRVTVFVPEGPLHRRFEEVHALCLYEPGQVEAALEGAGFSWERLDGYGHEKLGAGWYAYVARR